MKKAKETRVTRQIYLNARLIKVLKLNAKAWGLSFSSFHDEVVSMFLDEFENRSVNYLVPPDEMVPVLNVRMLKSNFDRLERKALMDGDKAVSGLLFTAFMYHIDKFNLK